MKDYSKISDEVLIRLVRTKDKELFAEVMNRYQTKLLRFAGNLLMDDDKAQDAVQNAFIKTYMNINSFDIKKKFSSWIYRIVHNEAINLITKDRLKVQLGDEIEFDSGVDLEEELIKKQVIEHTRDCLGRLPVIYAEPLSLFYLEDKTYEEIGDILRLPTGTVGTRINRAKKLMKSICQK